MDFEITTRPLESAVTEVELSGELDIAVANRLRERLDALVRDGKLKLLINLSEVTFIDSTALGVLLEVTRTLRRQRGRLAVLCPDPQMRDLFALVGHNLIFPVDATRERALARLSPARRFARSANARSPRSRASRRS